MGAVLSFGAVWSVVVDSMYGLDEKGVVILGWHGDLMIPARWWSIPTVLISWAAALSSLGGGLRLWRWGKPKEAPWTACDLVQSWIPVFFCAFVTTAFTILSYLDIVNGVAVQVVPGLSSAAVIFLAYWGGNVPPVGLDAVHRSRKSEVGPWWTDRHVLYYVLVIVTFVIYSIAEIVSALRFGSPLSIRMLREAETSDHYGPLTVPLFMATIPRAVLILLICLAVLARREAEERQAEERRNAKKMADRLISVVRSVRGPMEAVRVGISELERSMVNVAALETSVIHGGMRAPLPGTHAISGSNEKRDTFLLPAMFPHHAPADTIKSPSPIKNTLRAQHLRKDLSQSAAAVSAPHFERHRIRSDPMLRDRERLQDTQDGATRRFVTAMDPTKTMGAITADMVGADSALSSPQHTRSNLGTVRGIPVETAQRAFRADSRTRARTLLHSMRISAVRREALRDILVPLNTLRAALRDAVPLVRTTLGALGGVLEDVERLARLEEGRGNFHAQPTNPRDILEDVVTNHRDLAHAIHVHLHPVVRDDAVTLGAVSVDPALLRIALRTLVAQALDALRTDFVSEAIAEAGVDAVGSDVGDMDRTDGMHAPTEILVGLSRSPPPAWLFDTLPFQSSSNGSTADHSQTRALSANNKSPLATATSDRSSAIFKVHVQEAETTHHDQNTPPPQRLDAVLPNPQLRQNLPSPVPFHHKVTPLASEMHHLPRAQTASPPTSSSQHPSASSLSSSRQFSTETKAGDAIGPVTALTEPVSEVTTNVSERQKVVDDSEVKEVEANEEDEVEDDDDDDYNEDILVSASVEKRAIGLRDSIPQGDRRSEDSGKKDLSDSGKKDLSDFQEETSVSGAAPEGSSGHTSLNDNTAGSWAWVHHMGVRGLLGPLPAQRRASDIRGSIVSSVSMEQSVLARDLSLLLLGEHSPALEDRMARRWNRSPSDSGGFELVCFWVWSSPSTHRSTPSSSFSSSLPIHQAVRRPRSRSESVSRSVLPSTFSRVTPALPADLSDEEVAETSHIALDESPAAPFESAISHILNGVSGKISHPIHGTLRWMWLGIPRK